MNRLSFFLKHHQLFFYLEENKKRVSKGNSRFPTRKHWAFIDQTTLPLFEIYKIFLDKTNFFTTSQIRLLLFLVLMRVFFPMFCLKLCGKTISLLHHYFPCELILLSILVVSRSKLI